MNKIKVKKLGFTLIEILLIVGFIATAGLGVYIIYNKVRINNYANTEARNLDLIRGGVKHLLANFNNTASISNAIINNAGVMPNNMRNPSDINIINNPFGGTITVSPVNLNGVNDGFRIEYTNVPNGVCVKLATGNGSKFERLTINGVVVKNLGTNTQVNIPTAVAQCGTDVGMGVTMFFDSIK